MADTRYVPLPSGPGRKEPEAKKAAPDVVVLNANRGGDDYVIGDVHGHGVLFDTIFRKVAENKANRLFIVGDLADRGPHSKGVYQFLINHKRRNGQPPIHIARGNHEDNLLNALNAIKSKEEFESLRKQYKEAKGSRFEHAVDAVYTQCPPLALLIPNGGDWIFKDDITFEELQQIRDFVMNIPYVISVRGDEKNSPFHIVHADMPASLSDEALQKTEAKDIALSYTEKSYATWARRGGEVAINQPRSGMCVPVVCGHSPNEETNSARPESNHNNIDTSNDPPTMCLMNISKGTVQIYREAFNHELNQKVAFPWKPENGGAGCIPLTDNLMRIQQLLTKNTNFQRGLSTALSKKPDEVGRAVDDLLMAALKQYERQMYRAPEKATVEVKKKLYLQALQKILPQLDANQRRALASHMLSSKKHLLAEERGFRWSKHSNQTLSIHKAMGLLLPPEHVAPSASALFSPATRTGHKEALEEAQKNSPPPFPTRKLE